MSLPSPSTIAEPENSTPLRQYLEGLIEHLNDRIAQAMFQSPREVTQEPIQLDLAPRFIASPAHPNLEATETEYDSFGAAFQAYGGRVLLLADVDAGKTTTLLQFARDKYLERLADPTKPMPYLINIRHCNSWNQWDQNQEPSLYDFVREQNPTLSKLHPDSEPLLCIFDGLEEMFVPLSDDHNPHRRFMQYIARQAPDAQVVISYDEQLYNKFGFQTSLNGIVKLLPLETGVIQQFLEAKGQQNLWQALESSPALFEVARTSGPLRLLSFAVGDEKTPMIIPLGDDPRSSVFDYFIDASYRRAAADGPLEFDLATTRFLLQKLAAYLWRVGQFDSILLTLNYPQIKHQVGEKWEEFLKLAFALHYLWPVSSYAVQFVNRKFRDHCAFSALMEAVNNDDLGAARSLRQFEVPATLPAILQSLKHENSHARAAAARALAEIKEPTVVPVLLNLLNDESEYTRRYVMLALDNHRSLLTIPDLLTALNVVHGDVRKKILELLGYFKDPTTIPAVLNALNDDQSEVRAATVKALGEFKNPDLIPIIIGTLADKDHEVRRGAASTLGKLEDPAIVPALLPVLTDENKYVRRSALTALGELKDSTAIPAILNVIFNDENRFVRADAVRALRNFNSPELVPVLLELFEDEERGVRAQAGITLGKFDAPTIIPILLEALQSDNSFVRAGAATALGQTKEPTIIPVLLNILNDEEKSVRVCSLKSLEKFKDAVSTMALHEAMNSQYSDVRVGAISLLPWQPDPANLPALLNAMQDEDFLVRAYAVSKLGYFDDAVTFPTIANALKDENEHVRHNAARTFRFTKYAPSGPALVNVLTDENKDVRYNAVMGLGNLKDPTAIPALLQALEEAENERNSYMCMLVAEALEKFQVVGNWRPENKE